MMTGGYTGKVLEIDLGRRRHVLVDTDRQAAQHF